MPEVPPARPPIITATVTINGQTIQADVYGNPETGSLVIHDQQGQLVTWHMGRFPALFVALRRINDELTGQERTNEDSCDSSEEVMPTVPPRIWWSESDAQKAQQYCAEAQATLDNPTATHVDLRFAYDCLNDWHLTFHGGRQALPCTGCQVYPVLTALAARLKEMQCPILMP
jgi:hypothetical protein